MQRTDSVKWERTLDFSCVVVVFVMSVVENGRNGGVAKWRFHSCPPPPLFFAVGCGGDGRLVGFLALRPPTSDSVRILVSPT